MADLLELVVGEGTEFKLLLESAPANIKAILNSSIRSYTSPSSAFSGTFGRENNVNLFRFFRMYGKLSLKPLVLKLALQSEELAKSYGTMLGFAISYLSQENLSPEQLTSYLGLCEKAILQRASPKLIHDIGVASLTLHKIRQKSPIPIPEVQKLEVSLHTADSLEKIFAAINEIAKINSILSPRNKNKWAYSQLPA